MLRVADLFCGAGLFSAGFHDVGFNVGWGIDNDKRVLKTFRHNFPKATTLCVDIEELDVAHTFPKHTKPDIIIGSPPCKEFSKGNNDRTFDYSLVQRYIEIVKEVDPKYFVMENVPDIVTLKFIEEYKSFFPTLQILDASSFGAATWRKRLFAGNFPRVKSTMAKPLAVQDVININRSGYCQPFKEKVYRKIDPTKPLFTLCSQGIGNERYLLPNGTSLTVSEMAQCQGVPSWFIFPCSRSEMQRQLGLSVSPPVAKAIAENIMKQDNSFITQ